MIANVMLSSQCALPLTMLLSLCRSLVRVLPSPIALALIRALLRRSQRPEVTPEQQGALQAAVRVNYGSSGTKVAWSWGSGPLVLFVHGWNGRAAQLAPLAQQVAWEGFNAVCIDVTAHGESASEQPSWRHFLDDVVEAATHFGTARAFVGHSAGALAMVAAHTRKQLHADAYVCVCAPSHPFPPIRTVQQLLDPPARILAACRAEIAEQFGMAWEQLEDGAAWRAAMAALLLIYDVKDRFVDHTEGDRVLRWTPQARLLKTEGHGHTRILASDELARALVEFLSESSVEWRYADSTRRSEHGTYAVHELV